MEVFKKQYPVSYYYPTSCVKSVYDANEIIYKYHTSSHLHASGQKMTTVGEVVHLKDREYFKYECEHPTHVKADSMYVGRFTISKHKIPILPDAGYTFPEKSVDADREMIVYYQSGIVVENEQSIYIDLIRKTYPILPVSLMNMTCIAEETEPIIVKIYNNRSFNAIYHRERLNKPKLEYCLVSSTKKDSFGISHEVDLEEAEREFKEALKLEPRDAFSTEEVELDDRGVMVKYWKFVLNKTPNEIYDEDGNIIARYITIETTINHPGSNVPVIAQYRAAILSWCEQSGEDTLKKYMRKRTILWLPIYTEMNYFYSHGHSIKYK